MLEDDFKATDSLLSLSEPTGQVRVGGASITERGKGRKEAAGPGSREGLLRRGRRD